jgi:hypothetical protein
LRVDGCPDVDAHPVPVVPILGSVIKRGVPSPLPMFGRGEGVRVNPRFLEDKESELRGIVEGT